MKFIAWLKVTFPVLWSAQWWGVVFTALFQLALTKAWIDADWATFLRDVFGLGTAVGVIFKTARKLSVK